jgi:hypothetical protein
MGKVPKGRRFRGGLFSSDEHRCITGPSIRYLGSMKASRLNKLEARLALTEGSLLDQLMQVLPRVIKSGEMLFFNSEFLPDAIRPNWLPRESEALLSLAKEAVSLRNELSLSLIGSVGQLYLSVCSEAANSANENRRGPRQLAMWLLGELGPNLSFKAGASGAA